MKKGMPGAHLLCALVMSLSFVGSAGAQDLFASTGHSQFRSLDARLKQEILQRFLCQRQRLGRQRDNQKFWAGAGQMKTVDLNVQGVSRRCFVYYPNDGGKHKPYPLVMAFHGGGGRAEGMDRCMGGITKLADQEGFMVAFPEGVDHHWNDGRKTTVMHVCDDLAFSNLLIDGLLEQGLIDRGRVYATGISNGGFFSQYLAINYPDRIAAVASIAASVPEEYTKLPKSKPLPISFLLGTADPLIPWEGGRIGGAALPADRGSVISAAKSIDYWLGRNNNKSKPRSGRMQNDTQEDGCDVSVTTYGSDTADNEVVFATIKGGGHTWPQGFQYLPAQIIGPVCRDFNGNEFIWKFLSRHKLEGN